MKANASQRWLIILLAVASVGTTLLVGLTVWNRHEQSLNHADGLRGGVMSTTAPNEVPILTTLPSFTLIDHNEAAFGSEHLRGKVWIADFIFSRCAGPCPMMTSRLARLQTKLNTHDRWDDIRLVSISVDGNHDTPAVLKRYAQAAGADDHHWLFLTGSQKDVWQLVTNGFRLPIGEDIKNASMPIFHSQKFVLVDALGRVRGFYDALEPNANQKLLKDLNRILAQTPPSASLNQNPVGGRR